MLKAAYFRNAIINPTRRASMIQRIVSALVNANEYGDIDEFARWIAFYQRMINDGHLASMSAPTDLIEGTPAAALKIGIDNVLESVAHDTYNADIYSPMIMCNLSRRINTGREITTTVIENILADEYTQAQGCDREMIERIARRNARLFYCDDCGELHTHDTRTRTRDGNEICAGCLENDYTYSDYYEDYIRASAVRYALDREGHEVTVDEDDDDFEWSDEHDTYLHIEYARRRVIRGYHESKGHFREITCDWTRRHNRLMGIELEVEAGGNRPDDIAARIHDIVNNGTFGHRVFFERDGSLTNGFEIITQPMGLPTIRETFGFLKDPRAIEGLRSHRTSTCGLHVHVARTGLNNLIISRAVTFVNDPRNDAFITAIARRYNTGFCKILEKEPETAHVSADRYEAINLTPRHTIEFRIFRGSLKFEAVIAAAEFCHALLEYCARAETTASSMNAQAFLTWCANSLTDDTKIMREYIAQRTAGTFAAVEAA